MTKEGPFGARKPHEPSRMRMYAPVTVEDVLSSLVGPGARVESTMGIQLEIMKARSVKDEQTGKRVGKLDPSQAPRQADAFGRSGQTMDAWQAMDRAEMSMGLDLGVTNCVDGLLQVERIDMRWISGLVSLHKMAPGRSQGELAIGCLRAYHERALRSQLRALAEVYCWSRRVTGTDVVSAEQVAHEFGLGKGGEARKQAARLYSDALAVLSEWVRVWNRKASEDWHRT